MAKTNYTKVEESLAEGMRKIEVDKLLTIADENAAKKPKKTTAQTPKVDAANLHRLNWIHRELKVLQKAEKDPYIRLGISKEEVTKFLNDPLLLTPEDWEKTKSIKEKITNYKAELNKEATNASDDDLINRQRKNQTTKRFNVNDKWIPLR